jgi:hypothetical protein
MEEFLIRKLGRRSLAEDCPARGIGIESKCYGNCPLLSCGKARAEIPDHPLARSEFANFGIFIWVDITRSADDCIDTGLLIKPCLRT